MPIFDFPHTRNYDSDLGFLINQYESLTKIYTDIMSNITGTVETMITEGKISLDFTYTESDEKISFLWEVK